MNIELSNFVRLRFASARQARSNEFDAMAVELFALQYKYNSAYARICEARHLTPHTVEHWTQIPFVPTAAFKELELSCIPQAERTAVFHSSGTTEQKPSRHFHCAESLAVYETSLWQWFSHHFSNENDFVFLTPNQHAAPHSSLVHMFETVRKNVSLAKFFGGVTADGAWTLDFETLVQKLKSAGNADGKPLTILGTAFSFVHLLDFLAANNLNFKLPAGSRMMETGGYKNRSRVMPKAELHALIAKHLGVNRENIVCEYGMSELSSQAYDSEIHAPSSILHPRAFHFPPWVRAQIISPETGREVVEGETGLIRIFDLANVYSVAAIQTEDLAIRHGDGFELIGRAQFTEPRGCSLMTA